MQCEKSFKICTEWAADFRQMGQDDMAGFWETMAMIFHSPMQVFMPEDSMDDVIHEVQRQIDLHPSLMSMVKGMPQKQIQDMKDIHQERIFMLGKLKELKQEVGLV